MGRPPVVRPQLRRDSLGGGVTHSSLVRASVITLCLVAVGAIVGAVAGAIVMVGGVVLSDRSFPRGIYLPIAGAYVGALVGAPLAPLAGWLLLRHVPLGQAILVTGLGTIAGGVIGLTARVTGDAIRGAIICGVFGFVVAAVYLRASIRRKVAPSDNAAA